MRESTERVARERKIPQLKYKKAPVTPESINSALSQLYSAANKTLEQSHNYETSVNVVIVVQHYSQMFFQTSYNIEIDKLLKEALDDLTKIQSYKKV